MPSLPSSTTLISVVIVNYKVPDYLRETLRSLREAQQYENCEVIVVDNDSQDNSKQIITTEYPEVNWIQMKSNVGFGKASNIGASHADGTYLLLLNPDTVISKDTLSKSANFMREHPEVGLMGPKILNPNGSLQASCRRSFPSAADAMYHLTGLSKLFPKSKFFGKYNLTYMNPDISTQVDAISGSYMFMPLSLFKKIGGFDEQFFMYGEDLDLCWRVKEAGYKVWYNPDTQIVHRKGKSSDKVKLKSRIAFYEAMVIFSKKYKNTNRGFFPGWLIFMGIFIQASINIFANIIKFSKPAIIDLVIINLSLWLSFLLRFSHSENPYTIAPWPKILAIHIMISLCFLFVFIYNGVYVKKRHSTLNTFLSACVASICFVALIFFVNSLAFSRIVFALSSLVISTILIGWRVLTPKVIHRFKQVIYSPSNILIIGNDTVAKLLIKNIEEHKSGKIIGILKTDNYRYSGEFEGYPILGEFSELKTIFKNNKIDLLLIATSLPWYSIIIDALSSSNVKNVCIQWVPHEFFQLNKNSLPSTIPLRNFSV